MSANYNFGDHEKRPEAEVTHTRQRRACARKPSLASGGAGTLEHFYKIFKAGHADAALAASIFHFGEIEIPELKGFLRGEKIAVR